VSRTKVQNENEDTRNQCKIRWSNESVSGVMSGNVSDKDPLERAVWENWLVGDHCDKRTKRWVIR